MRTIEIRGGPWYFDRPAPFPQLQVDRRFGDDIIGIRLVRVRRLDVQPV